MTSWHVFSRESIKDCGAYGENCIETETVEKKSCCVSACHHFIQYSYSSRRRPEEFSGNGWKIDLLLRAHRSASWDTAALVAGSGAVRDRTLTLFDEFLGGKLMRSMCSHSSRFAVGVLLFSAVCLAACGGGGGGSDAPAPLDDVNGIWREPASNTIGIISGGGSDVDIIRGCCTRLNGTLRARQGAIYDSVLDEYFSNSGAYCCHYLGEGTVIPKAAIHATYTDSSSGRELTLDMTYDPISDRQPSLDVISGIWSQTTGDYTITITIDASGSLFGSDTDGCTYTGSVTAPDPSVNTYKIRLGLGSCFGVNDGQGIIMDTVTDNDTFLFAVSGYFAGTILPFSFSDTLYRQ